VPRSWRKLRHDWEFNVLDIYNYGRAGRLETYFNFIAGNLDMPGDICEAGVYRGNSLLATALWLKELGSDKRVIGFDSFKGLPVSHPFDAPARFTNLARAGRISQDHHRQVSALWKIRSLMLGELPTPHTISSCAGDMSDTDLNLLVDKMDYLGLDNIDIHIGPFKETMVATNDYIFMAALMDCDFYESYKTALPYIWEHLSPGGFVFLDEYYSLKFPGARIACDMFFENRPEKPQLLSKYPGEFERWGVIKSAD